jgi:tRNA threonylcarbamoyladenosine biosynthesis protein TsaB
MFLALDTSTLTLSMALLERGPPIRLVEQVRHGPPRKQSEMLPGVIQELLLQHRVDLRELQAFVVGLGPGSFTGLRIGVATAKALAYALRVPLAGASSLAAAALEGPPGRELWPIAVARQQELYVGRYRRAGDRVEALGPEEAHAPAEIAARLVHAPDAVLLGPAVPEYRQHLERLGVAPERILDLGAVPSACALGQLARIPESFDAQALFALEPHYVRPSEAERNPRFPPSPGPPPTARLSEE